MVDIEADGPIPGDFSMILIGAIVVDKQLDKTFYGQLQPISDRYVPAALAISGFTKLTRTKKMENAGAGYL